MALGALIGAGASLLGGFMQSKQADKQAELQKQFAQSGIQWKVRDAEKAGIHPLYALGAQTTSYQPTQVGDLGIAEAGQNIGRAIDATRSNPAKVNALSLTASQIQLEGLKLDNELKKAQLASAVALAHQTQHAPGLPGPFTQSAIVGQGNTEQTDPSRLPLMHSARQPQYTTNLKVGGYDVMPSPNWSDAQTFQDRYGEPGEWAASVPIAVADWFHNVSPLYRKQILDKLRYQKY